MSDITGGLDRIEPIFITVKDAAKVLGVATYRMYELTSGRNPAIEVRWEGPRKLVSVRSLREYAANLPTERQAESA